jgi:hypothetical protein
MDRLNVGGLLYGTIVSAAAMALGVNHGATVDRMIEAMSATLLIYWLAHVYTEAMSGRAPASLRRRVRAAAWHEATILLGGIPTLVMVIVLTLAGVSLWTTVLVTLALAVVVLGLDGYLAGRYVGLAGWRLAAESVGSALFGGLLAVLLVWLHNH